jgi:hypothetical protein
MYESSIIRIESYCIPEFLTQEELGEEAYTYKVVPILYKNKEITYTSVFKFAYDHIELPSSNGNFRLTFFN